ncbi:hypothetical protein [Anabaena azotica]|uniref:Uncharacterized protein n=1 Tax=Anabaena azotica FACHB-119 TaxID=947527 RepID=A0ABR8D4A5_9NOST|nr:hypothetical protein [Anabaena azotica]MBD2501993.1 hypothetical protein [Anabaena azotica FACHB-119]
MNVSYFFVESSYLYVCSKSLIMAIASLDHLNNAIVTHSLRQSNLLFINL